MCATRGYCLGDLVTKLSAYGPKLGLPARVCAKFMVDMAGLQHRLAFATADKIQINALVAAFVVPKAALRHALAMVTMDDGDDDDDSRDETGGGGGGGVEEGGGGGGVEEGGGGGGGVDKSPSGDGPV